MSTAEQLVLARFALAECSVAPKVDIEKFCTIQAFVNGVNYDDCLSGSIVVDASGLECLRACPLNDGCSKAACPKGELRNAECHFCGQYCECRRAKCLRRHGCDATMLCTGQVAADAAAFEASGCANEG